MELTEADPIAAAGVRLRALDPEGDLAPMHAIFGDAASMRFMSRPPAASPDQTRALLQSWASAPQWAILLDEDEVVGRITLVPVRRGVAEIGVQVVPAARGRGVGTRAVIALTGHALERGLIRVAADIDPENRPSLRVFEKAGYAYEGLLRHNWLTHTGPADSAMYAATDQWSAPALSGNPRPR